MEVWAEGAAYEAYVGRWSRLIAREYLQWLNLPAGLHWLDVGCGTGALSRTVLERADPRALSAIDQSAGFLRTAADVGPDPRCAFACADAQALPLATDSIDAVVSGLVLNFVPDTGCALLEMKRVIRPGGTVSVYVWDYADGMEMLRIFWDEAGTLDSAAINLHEGRRFPLCNPEPLAAAFRAAGLADVESSAVAVPTVYRDFADFWKPFLGGQGPAPMYVAGLSADRQAELRERLRTRLSAQQDGSIHLRARAWAVRGVKR
jgi:SAM-dependent methyltransferase